MTGLQFFHPASGERYSRPSPILRPSLPFIAKHAEMDTVKPSNLPLNEMTLHPFSHKARLLGDPYHSGVQ
jgi:hypothetical protein